MNLETLGKAKQLDSEIAQNKLEEQTYERIICEFENREAHVTVGVCPAVRIRVDDEMCKMFVEHYKKKLETLKLRIKLLEEELKNL